VILAVVGYFLLTAGHYQTTDNAYVQIAKVPVAPSIGGRVTDIYVTENQFVHRGQILFRIDARDMQASEEAAAAQARGFYGARRKAFLTLAKKYRLPVVEDDPYGSLRFTGQTQPSLYSLAGGKGVLYLSTFSKILSPGIRLGFVVAEKPVIQELVLAKQAADLQPNSLIQRAVYHYGKNGHLDRHIPAIIRSYKERAGVMLLAMERHFPKALRWLPPEGGMFVWVTLPKGMSASQLFKKAVDANVAYVTGGVFHANGGGDQTLRLNFTNSTLEQLEEGIKRLGKVFSEAL